jgi:hypothetical protein
MGKAKKKDTPFSRLVSDALSGADETEGMNAKMVLAFIKQKQQVGDDKAVSF